MEATTTTTTTTDVYAGIIDNKKRPKQDDDADDDPANRTDEPPRKKKKKHRPYQLSGPLPSWNDMFFALLAFKSKLGTFHVPAQTKLGRWVQKQRQEYSKLQRQRIQYHQCSELSEERIQVLDSLGFIWDTMLHENGRRWNQVCRPSSSCVWMMVVLFDCYLFVVLCISRLFIIIMLLLRQRFEELKQWKDEHNHCNVRK